MANIGAALPGCQLPAAAGRPACCQAGHPMQAASPIMPQRRFGYGANSPERQALFQTGWFTVGLLTQTLIVHMIRTERIPFLQEVRAGLGRAELPLQRASAWVGTAAAAATCRLGCRSRVGQLLMPCALPEGGFFVLLQVAAWPVVVMTLLISGALPGPPMFRVWVLLQLLCLPEGASSASCPKPRVPALLPCAAVGLALPYTPVGGVEGMAPLPPSFYGWVAATLAGGPPVLLPCLPLIPAVHQR